MCPNICESARDKNYENNDTDTTFGADFFFLQNAGRKSFFYFFAQLKVQGRRKKSNQNRKEQFYFYSSFGKLGSADFVNQKNKK